MVPFHTPAKEFKSKTAAFANHKDAAPLFGVRAGPGWTQVWQTTANSSPRRKAAVRNDIPVLVLKCPGEWSGLPRASFEIAVDRLAGG